MHFLSKINFYKQKVRKMEEGREEEKGRGRERERERERGRKKEKREEQLVITNYYSRC